MGRSNDPWLVMLFILAFLVDAAQAMPEIRECYCHYYLVLMFYLKYSGVLDFTVESLWADRGCSDKDAGGEDGMVYQLDATSTVVRGGRHPGSIWPPMWKKTKDNPNPPSITTLVWAGVENTGRATVFNLGALYLKLAYLTHTMVQIYWRANGAWDRIKSVHRNLRAKVGLAIVFKDFVIAFMSQDNVYMPEWAISRDSFLGIEPPPVYSCEKEKYWAFLDAFAGFLETWEVELPREKVSKLKKALVCDALRMLGCILVAIGVYTRSEIPVGAGFHHFLTLQEVIHNPSRCARLAEYYWQYCHITVTRVMKEVVYPALDKDGVLAPTIAQRLRYPTLLLVWGRKNLNSPTKRFKDLLIELTEFIHEKARRDMIWFRETKKELYDPYEPALMLDALQQEGHLGHLIFGVEEWKRLTGRDPVEDPLTAYFRRKNLLNEPTHLKPGHYDTLSGMEGKANRKGNHLIKTYTYTTEDNKKVFTCLPAFDIKSFRAVHDQVMRRVPIECTKEDRDKVLFEHTVQTKLQNMGVLEYSGMGDAWVTTTGQVKTSVLRNDVPKHIKENRDVKDIKEKFFADWHKKYNFVYREEGKRIVALREQVPAEQYEAYTRALAEVKRPRSEVPANSEPKAKRRRTEAEILLAG